MLAICLYSYLGSRCYRHYGDLEIYCCRDSISDSRTSFAINSGAVLAEAKSSHREMSCMRTVFGLYKAV